MLVILYLAQSIWQDLRYGLRQLWSNPGFASIAVLILALGMGANASIFSVLDALILRPLAVPNSDGLYEIYRGNGRPCSYPDFVDFQQRANLFSGLAADITTESALDLGDSSQVILAEAVSYNYAVTLGARPVLGRWFAAEDEHSGGFPAVISYRAWQSRFGADPHVIGKQVRLESQWYTVEGVAPKDFQGMALPVLTDVWVPLVRYAQHNQFAARIMKDRQGNKVLMFGRLKPAVAASQAVGQLNTVDVQLRREYPRAHVREMALRLERARGTSDPAYARLVTQLLMLLTAIVAVVLLSACANVANLLLARGVSRRREVAVRLAIGAGGARVCRQMLVESLLLSLFGAIAGLGAAYGGNRVLETGLASAPSPISLGVTLSLDGRVVAFVLIISVVTTFLFGLVPSLQASKPDLVSALKGREPLSRNRRLTLQNASAVIQVALSLALLIAAGLFIRALRKASSADPGFDTRSLLSARLYVAKPEFNQVTGMALYRSVLVHVRLLPGVQNATLSYASPMLAISECVVQEGAGALPQPITAGANIVGPDYFSTVGIPLVRGRDFTSSDNSSAPSVAIVNETLARRYWPRQDPIGARIRFGDGCGRGLGTVAEIVGVAKDAQYASGGTILQPYIFYPLEQHFVGYVALVLKTKYDPAALAATLRKELRSVDSRLRIYAIDTLSAEMDKSLWQARWEASLLGMFGALALVIASVGLYGGIAFVAKQRMLEFGIRIALGAQRRDVLRLVTSDGLMVALFGVGIGILVSLALTNLFRGFLYGLSPADPATYIGAGLLWVAVSLIASCVPAYRAARVDPSVTLREE